MDKKGKIRIFDQIGVWLSPVEHLVRDEGVGGSNPLTPTHNTPGDPLIAFLFGLTSQ